MSANRFYGSKNQQKFTQTTAKGSPRASEFNQGYVIAYKTDAEGTRALVGQKNVISAHTENKLKSYPNSFAHIKEKIQNQQWNKCMETHFNYLFYDAGGRSSCLGGNIKPSETAIIGAAREFLEETGIEKLVDKVTYASLINELEKNLSLLYTSHRFKGIYFSLDINTCPLLQKYLSKIDITDYKPSSEKYDPELDKKPKDTEMHELTWVPIKNLVDYMDQATFSDKFDKYTDYELNRGVNILFKTLFPTEEKELKNLKDKCLNHLKWKIRKDPTYDNKDAATALEKMILNAEKKAQTASEEQTVVVSKRPSTP